MQARSTTPQQTLQQYVADLQKNSNDSALREKIIRLAHEMKPAPTLPPEVHELAGGAAYAIKHATSDADFVAAADAYGKASLLAPWVPDYCFNRGVAYEKASRFDEAIVAFNWYLIAAPDAKDSNEVRERIGGLKYAKEKVGRQEAERADSERRQREEAASKQSEEDYLRGRWKMDFANIFSRRGHSEFTLDGDTLTEKMILDYPIAPQEMCKAGCDGRPVGYTTTSLYKKIRDRVFEAIRFDTRYALEFSGDTIVQTIVEPNGKVYNYYYKMLP